MPNEEQSSGKNNCNNTLHISKLIDFTKTVYFSFYIDTNYNEECGNLFLTSQK